MLPLWVDEDLGVFEKNTFINVGAASRAAPRRGASCPARIESRVVPTPPPCQQRCRRRGCRRRKAAPAAPYHTFERLLQSATTAEDVLSLAGQHLGSLTFPQAVLTLKQLAKLDQTASRDYLVSGAFLKVTSRLKDTFPRPVDEDSLPSTIDNLVWALGRLEALSLIHI